MFEAIPISDAILEVLCTMEDREEAERLMEVVLRAKARHPASIVERSRSEGQPRL